MFGFFRSVQQLIPHGLSLFVLCWFFLASWLRSAAYGRA
ncbi:hypothetical protein CIPAW_03G146400 [Carya illinoinensis]|uniref:Uncharacterized protein n=1 Tax=Carya illinoinensis TaxID=32201 RepID=A0A8T1R3Q5_CARIL|nr:hypothetical protein CIPAW_03G146400 [Carya illinoinensis]